MKNLFSIFGISIILLLSSCTSESSSSQSNVLNGQWKLVNVSGSFAGISHDFEPGLITWDFNPTTQMITIVNNNTNNELFDFFETGVYNYQIVSSSDPNFCTEVIKIDVDEIGCFSVINDTLQINEAHVDGYTASFVH